MALVDCRECQKEISDQAAACPHCGAPVKNLQRQQTVNKKSGFLRWTFRVFLGFIGLSFILVLIAQATSDHTADISSSNEFSQRTTEREAIAMCWKDQERKSHDPSYARVIASVCEKMENDYRTKWRREP